MVPRLHLQLSFTILVAREAHPLEGGRVLPAAKRAAIKHTHLLLQLLRDVLGRRVQCHCHVDHLCLLVAGGVVIRLNARLPRRFPLLHVGRVKLLQRSHDWHLARFQK